MFGRKKKKEQSDYKKVEVKEEVPEENPMQKIAKETGNESKEVYVVVKELPTQIVRRAKAEDGTTINYVTVEEALTEFINEE